MLFFGNNITKYLMSILIIFCAILVTLGCVGLISLTSKPVQIADDFIKVETGVDIEEVEEELFGKKWLLY